MKNLHEKNGDLVLRNLNQPLDEYDLYELNGFYYIYVKNENKLIAAGNSIQEARRTALYKFYEQIESSNPGKLL